MQITLGIVLINIFVWWFLAIFDIKIQSENDHKLIRIKCQAKVKDLIIHE